MGVVNSKSKLNPYGNHIHNNASQDSSRESENLLH